MDIYLVIFIIIFTIISYKMAKNRGRNGFGWAVFGLIVSPLLVWVILLVIGDTEEKRKEKADFKAFKENCL